MFKMHALQLKVQKLLKTAVKVRCICKLVKTTKNKKNKKQHLTEDKSVQIILDNL